MHSVSDELDSRNRLARAQRGDEDAFAELTEPYRRELQVHCYRILGSLQDAEDLLQETLLAAWRGLERFEGRSSLRAWLYTIATNRCLNALRDRGRRPQAVARAGPAGPVRELRRDPVARALSGRAARGDGRRGAGPRGALRGQGVGRAGVRLRSAAPGAAPAGGAGPARRARLSCRRGRRHARLLAGVGQQRAAARAGGARDPRSRGPRAPGHAAHRRRARAGRPLRGRVRAR